ncbi:MAG: ATP-binding protein [Geothrix sp.]|nr:ATP-binding protein [Geothrix sp.]
MATLLAAFSILQKVIMGLPADQILSAKAYIVPVGFGGAIGALLGTYHARLRQSNLDLAQSLGRLRAVMDTVPAGIFLVDLATQEVVDANRFALHLLGRRREELMGSRCHEFICPEEGACPFAAPGIQQDSAERILLSAAGERIPVLKTATILDLDGRRLLLESFLDLRERVSLEEQLRHAQRMEILGKTAAGIVHDFNNLLAAIEASVNLAVIQEEDREIAHSHLDCALAACQRGSRLLRGLQAFNRKTPLEPRPMDLNQTLLEVQDLLGRLLPQEIEVQLDLWPEPLEVWGDSGQLGQVLLNLAVNARDAMKEGGRLRIATSRQGGPARADAPAAILEVHDTGVGIPADHLAHIFEAFYTTKAPDQGSGLGLSIVKGIVEQHQGNIQVESAPGKGTLIRIRLPIHIQAATP